MRRIRARVLTPVDATTVRWWSDAIVVVEDGRITAVGEPDGQPVDEDLRPGVLLPGFVDAHLHYPQTRIVGAASGPLLEWLARSTFPEEARFADPDHARQVAEVFATALAAAGTTLAYVYGSTHPEATEILFRTLARRGLRAIAGPVLMDEHAPDAVLLPADRALAELEALADRWDGHDAGRLRVAIIPRFALSCSNAMLRGAGDLAYRTRLPVSTHLAENVEECRVARERFGVADYLSVYEDAGLLVNGSVFAHCIHLDDGELARMRRAGAVVAHCPDSNAFLGSGHMPLDRMLHHKVDLAIGTDVAAGRTFRIPRVLSAAYDNALAVGVDVDPRTLLWWGTRAGAVALGVEAVGQIAPGREADMVLVDVPEWVDDEDGVLAWTLFHTDAPPPRRTWVRGRVVWDRDAAPGPYPWSR